jgi:hypothetical protein
MTKPIDHAHPLPASARAMLEPWSRPPAGFDDHRTVRPAARSRQLLRLTGYARS